MNRSDKPSGFETRAIRIQAERGPAGEHSVPIFTTSSYRFPSGQAAADAFAGDRDGPIYGRFDNPNTDEFVEKLASLEGADTGLATGSGMGAVFLSLLGLLHAGDHVVGSTAVFGSTLSLLKEFLPRWGIETSVVPLTDLDAWRTAVRPRTRMFVMETPSNPGLEIANLAALADIAHGAGALLTVDNCFATPYLQRPLELGADIVTHSATKYIDGQGRVLGGAMLASRDIIDTVLPFYRNAGPSMSPFNGWVLSKSLETLSVRMERHCDNAVAVADFLAGHKRVRRVLHPERKDHPQHELAMQQMSRGGGMVTIEVDGDRDKTMGVMNSLRLFTTSANLGDTRSIVTHPASTTHSGVPEEVRASLGISDSTLRLSIGLETAQDLMDDLNHALNE